MWNHLVGDPVVGGRVLDQGEDAVGHEACGPHRTAAAGDLGDLDNTTAGGHLDPAAGAGRHHLVRADLVTGVDDDLNSVSAHGSKLPRAVDTSAVTVVVRPANAADREAVHALAPRLTEGVAAWRHPAAVASAVRGWVEASLDNAEDRDRAVLVAEDDGAVVGFCSLAVETHWSGGRDVYISELAVDSTREGRGIGRALVAAALDFAKACGCTQLTLLTGAANTRARAFYGQLGFLEEDVRLTLSW